MLSDDPDEDDEAVAVDTWNCASYPSFQNYWDSITHIVKRILDEVNAQTGDVDFALCMGDDIADKKMFTVRNNSFIACPLCCMHSLLLSHCVKSVAKFSAEKQNMFAFSVAVGKKPTNASFYVDDASSVTDVLVNLSGEQS